MKTQPCTSWSQRHSWDHTKNKTTKRVFLNGSALFELKGIYMCRVCGAKKLGAPVRERAEQGETT